MRILLCFKNYNCVSSKNKSAGKAAHEKETLSIENELTFTTYSITVA